LAEVKETVGVDLNANVEDLLPKFFECLPDNNCFLSGKKAVKQNQEKC